MSTVLEVSKIRKAFGPTVAVDELSLTVDRGEILGLLGPNGAGKTTAIRMIMGIISPDKGEISFRMSSEKGLDKKKIGYLPEERGLYADAKVLDSLVYLGSLKGMNKEQAKQTALDWLDQLELKKYAQTKLEKLSKGMQQKVQFIAAILHEPDVVMLDEPFSGLDPLNQDLFKEIIADLRNKGMAILLSAHQMAVVEELCDSICLINRGKPVLSGNLREIKRGYKEFIIELDYYRLDQEAVLKEIDRLSLDSVNETKIVFRYTGDQPINDLVRKLSDFGSYEEIEIRRPPLHDIFINVVRQKGGKVDESYLK
jgi:ABC-2 type transport system ATP-binding protein